MWGGEWISGQWNCQCSSLREEFIWPKKEQPCQEVDVDTGDRTWESGGRVGNEMREGTAGSWRAWKLRVGSYIRVYQMARAKCLSYGFSQLSWTNDSSPPTTCQTPCWARQQRWVSHIPLSFKPPHFFPFLHSQILGLIPKNWRPSGRFPDFEHFAQFWYHSLK